MLGPSEIAFVLGHSGATGMVVQDALTETADSRNESVVERSKDAAGREALFFDATELFVLLRDPGIHESSEQDLDALLCDRVDHDDASIGLAPAAMRRGKARRPRRTRPLAALCAG